jgi:hypothetical protein
MVHLEAAKNVLEQAVAEDPSANAVVFYFIQKCDPFEQLEPLVKQFDQCYNCERIHYWLLNPLAETFTGC